MKEYCLIIVDVQKDFYDPSGALYVNGAEKLPHQICEFIDKNEDIIGEIIYTLDWHNPDNESFKSFGGPWPAHCVKGTWGVDPAYPIEFVANKYNIPIRFYKKGQVIDEYGAFSHYEKTAQVFSEENSEKYGAFSNYEKTNDELTLYGENYPDYKENSVITKYKNFIVCGLCGDYCVLETIKNLKKIPNIEIYAAPKLILSIDGGDKFYEYIDEVTNEVYFIECAGGFTLRKI